ncbi:hypothetical protein [[Mycobacterium] holstebronense]|uniref:Carboxymuconolactone decarboxylase n=1 Tax=[Mycobacterium] holstebronense TaxID=3064288 RepID=A0ABM9LNG7_9MYCO|nr:hypothetical protein [Mycolicibacter sp. MU0102]CAJ1502011.1 hypothetical protein MU0102_001630 [Mycolicibacter sp. MU0102]
MSDITELHQALQARVLGQGGTAPLELRRAAYDNAGLEEPINTLIDKVTLRSYSVGDEDVDAARVVGLSEDEIFELVVCAAVGQATRQYTSALEALAEATEDRGT